MSELTRPTIVFADGTSEKLVFDFDALCDIEEQFGSLAIFSMRLNTGSRGKVLTTVAGGVTAALRHLDTPPELEEIRKRLDPQRANEYIDALDEAFAAALPSAEAAPAERSTDG